MPVQDATWFSIVLSLAGFGAFILAGAALLSLYAGSSRVALTCARYSVVLGTLAVVFCALWLSAMVLWPLEAAGFEGRNVPVYLLRRPMGAIVASSALAFVALPFALLVLRTLARRATSARWSTELAGKDGQVEHDFVHRMP